MTTHLLAAHPPVKPIIRIPTQTGVVLVSRSRRELVLAYDGVEYDTMGAGQRYSGKIRMDVRSAEDVANAIAFVMGTGGEWSSKATESMALEQISKRRSVHRRRKAPKTIYAPRPKAG